MFVFPCFSVSSSFYYCTKMQNLQVHQTPMGTLQVLVSTTDQFSYCVQLIYFHYISQFIHCLMAEFLKWLLIFYNYCCRYHFFLDGHQSIITLNSCTAFQLSIWNTDVQFYQIKTMVILNLCSILPNLQQLISSTWCLVLLLVNIIPTSELSCGCWQFGKVGP